MIKFEGTVIEFNKTNKYGVIYKYDNFVEHLDKLKKRVDDGMCLGELIFDTYNSFALQIANITHRIDTIEYDENSVVVSGKIIDTPKGKMLQDYINNGMKFGLSLRCAGSINTKNVADITSILSINIMPYDKCAYSCAELKVIEDISSNNVDEDTDKEEEL